MYLIRPHVLALDRGASHVPGVLPAAAGLPQRLGEDRGG
jgi:hypothetical protein